MVLKNIICAVLKIEIKISSPRFNNSSCSRQIISVLVNKFPKDIDFALLTVDFIESIETTKFGFFEVKIFIVLNNNKSELEIKSWFKNMNLVIIERSRILNNDIKMNHIINNRKKGTIFRHFIRPYLFENRSKPSYKSITKGGVFKIDDINFNSSPTSLAEDIDHIMKNMGHIFDKMNFNYILCQFVKKSDFNFRDNVIEFKINVYICFSDYVKVAKIIDNFSKQFNHVQMLYSLNDINEPALIGRTIRGKYLKNTSKVYYIKNNKIVNAADINPYLYLGINKTYIIN